MEVGVRYIVSNSEAAPSGEVRFWINPFRKKKRKKERGKKLPEGMASIPFLLPCERVFVLTKRSKNSEAVLVL